MRFDNFMIKYVRVKEKTNKYLHPLSHREMSRIAYTSIAAFNKTII